VSEAGSQSSIPDIEDYRRGSHCSCCNYIRRGRLNAAQRARSVNLCLIAQKDDMKINRVTGGSQGGEG